MIAAICCVSDCAIAARNADDFRGSGLTIKSVRERLEDVAAERNHVRPPATVGSPGRARRRPGSRSNNRSPQRPWRRSVPAAPSIRPRSEQPAEACGEGVPPAPWSCSVSIRSVSEQPRHRRTEQVGRMVLFLGCPPFTKAHRAPQIEAVRYCRRALVCTDDVDPGDEAHLVEVGVTSVAWETLPLQVRSASAASKVAVHRRADRVDDQRDRAAP